jgi:hypothetical protein
MIPFGSTYMALWGIPCCFCRGTDNFGAQGTDRCFLLLTRRKSCQRDVEYLEIETYEGHLVRKGYDHRISLTSRIQIAQTIASPMPTNGLSIRQCFIGMWSMLTRIPGGRLDDDALTRYQSPILLSSFNHSFSDSILHRPSNR